MTIEEVFEEYRDLSFDSYEQQRRVANDYRKSLLAAGMPEDDVEEEIEGWLETNWTQEDWKKYYGADSDEELDDAFDSDDYEGED